MKVFKVISSSNVLRAASLIALLFPVIFFYQNCQGPSGGNNSDAIDDSQQASQLINTDKVKGFDISASNSSPLGGEPVDIEIRALDENMSLVKELQGTASVEVKATELGAVQTPTGWGMAPVSRDICRVQIPFVNGKGQFRFRYDRNSSSGAKIFINIVSDIPSLYNGPHVLPIFSSGSPWMYENLTASGNVPSSVQTNRILYDSLSGMTLMLGDEAGYVRSDLYIIKLEDHNLKFEHVNFEGPVSNYGELLFDPYLRRIILVRSEEVVNGKLQTIRPEVWFFSLDSREWNKVVTMGTVPNSGSDLTVQEFNPSLKSITIGSGQYSGPSYVINYAQNDPRWVAITTPIGKPIEHIFTGGFSVKLNSDQLHLWWDCSYDSNGVRSCLFKPRLYPKIASCSLK